MLPRILIDTVKMPLGGKELRLYQHDKDFMIFAGSSELMSSRVHASEDELAKLAMKNVVGEFQPRVLIGGLGMGFTLRAALDVLPKKVEVLVAEIVPAVVKWNQGLLAPLAGNPLADKRVVIREVDVAELIEEPQSGYNAIVLDIDNGPEGLLLASNDWFYGFKGLKVIFAALRPRGVLGIWSASRDNQLTERLESVGFSVEEVRSRARPGGKGAHHHLWIATKTNKPEKTKGSIGKLKASS